MSNLRERQELRELTHLDEGIRRYYKRVESQEAGATKAGLSLVYRIMNVLIPHIEEQVRLLESGKTLPSQVPLAVQYMTEFRPDAVAYLTAKVVVSAGVARAKLTRTAMRLSNLIEEDYRFEELEQAEPALANSMSRKAAKWSRSSARRRIMRKAANVAGISRMGWNEQEKLKLGVKLIEMVSELTNVTELVHTREGKSTYKLVGLTEEAQQFLLDRHVELQGEEPLNRPMIHPPQPWTSPISGGYLTPRMRKDLVRGVTPDTRDELFSQDMPEVYDALNRVQATRWRVNRSVLDVMSQTWKAGEELGGLPPRDSMPLPERPASIDRKLNPDQMPESMRKDFDEWKVQAREVHQYNAVQVSKRVAVETKINTAFDLLDEEAIYFPHSLDFRGRLYPLTAELSPQSDDVAKGLLEFADGKPLGTNGAYWLHVQIANLFGVDKVSFDERVAWVTEHEKQLLDSAFDPLDGARFWTTADDPWCALAACFEYAGWTVQGEDYVSHLPIAMDGSCSGIQHFSAMLRDEVGGAAVNLRNTEAPSDIYTEVLEVTRNKLKASSEPLAKVWLDAVTRKIVKRPCMTYAYSVTSVGIRNQIADEMRKQKDGDYLPGHTNWEAAMFLAPIVEESIREVVDRAAEAMDWLKSVCKILSKQKVPTGWTTPLGFPVVQPYRKAVGKRIKLWFAGSRLQLTLKVVGNQIDGRKQTSSVAPNYVHSMDATHLMMVVNRLGDEGVTDHFAMIHDSFGVHACDVDEMHFIIRDEFIKLYSEERLVEFYQQSLLRLPGDEWPNVPTPPEAGELNLEEVRDADFFFA